MFLGSLVFKQSATEQGLAEDFVGALTTGQALSRSLHRESHIDLALKTQMVFELFSQFFSEEEANSMTRKCLREARLEAKERISIVELAQLHSEVERLLAGSVGAATAHRMLGQSNLFTEQQARDLSEVYAEILAGLKVTPDDLKRRIDYHQEGKRFSANMPQSLKKRSERELEISRQPKRN